MNGLIICARHKLGLMAAAAWLRSDGSTVVGEKWFMRYSEPAEEDEEVKAEAILEGKRILAHEKSASVEGRSVLILEIGQKAVCVNFLRKEGRVRLQLPSQQFIFRQIGEIGILK